jgi:DsbC/DsbD-like thiol-disulfide interchange protein
MKSHPYADLFPMMDTAEFNALCEDIKENGLQEPIVTFAGQQILDGRNRFKACQAVKITPKFQTYWGKDPLQYVLSKNLHRRHLNESQRAMLAATIKEMGRGKTQICVPTNGQLATTLNVSERSITDANRVLAEAPKKTVRKVMAGTVSVSAAKKEIRPEPNAEKVSQAEYSHIVSRLDRLMKPELEKLGIAIADKLE